MGDKSKDRYNSILEIIDKRLIPDEAAKKARGEVFTPLDLVRQMLYGIKKTAMEKEKKCVIWGFDEAKGFFDDDEDDRLGGIPLHVFRDSNSTWLDPANGIGNFPVVAFYMLDYQLGKQANMKGDSNKEKRRKHIVEKMLFMIELNKGNVNTSRKIFKMIAPNANSNICCADTLAMTDDKLQTVFGVKQFDVVMGNPPFQAFQEATGKRGGGDELYMKFVKKSLELLIANGYLVFVHPPSWRKPEYNVGRKKSKNADVFKLMAHEHQLIYLEIHNSDDGLRIFKAGTRYDWYILKNTKAIHETIINDETRTYVKVDLRNFEFLPNFNIKNVLKLFPKHSESSCELGEFDEKSGEYINQPCILYERSAYGSDKPWVFTSKTASFQYPLVHSTLKDGTRFLYSNRKDKGMFGISKVIFGESGINNPVIDMEGKYGMTQGAMAIVVKSKKEATRLNAFLQSNFCKNILFSCMWGGFRIDWRLFTYFKAHFWETDVNLNEAIISKQKNTQTRSKKKGGSHFNKFQTTRKTKRT